MRRFGAKRTLMIGATVLGCGYLVALFLMDAPWQLLVASCVASAGVGIGYAAMPTLILDAVPMREAGVRGGPERADALDGHHLGRGHHGHHLVEQQHHAWGGFAIPQQSAFHLCFVVGALAAFVGVAITATIPRRTPALPDARPVPEMEPAQVAAQLD